MYKYILYSTYSLLQSTKDNLFEFNFSLRVENMTGRCL